MSDKAKDLRIELANHRDVLIATYQKSTKKYNEDAILKHYLAEAIIQCFYSKAYLGKANPNPSPYKNEDGNRSEKRPMMKEDDGPNKQALLSFENDDDIIEILDAIRERLVDSFSDLVIKGHYYELSFQAMEKTRLACGFALGRIRDLMDKDTRDYEFRYI